jgi:hypothetical protein
VEAGLPNHRRLFLIIDKSEQAVAQVLIDYEKERVASHCYDYGCCQRYDVYNGRIYRALGGVGSRYILLIWTKGGRFHAPNFAPLGELRRTMQLLPR